MNRSRLCCVVALLWLPIPLRAAGPASAPDTPFRQKRAVLLRNEADLSRYELRTVRADRDGKVLVNTQAGLLKTFDDRLVPYRELAGIAALDHLDLELLSGTFVFLTNRMLLPLYGAGVDYRDNQAAGCKRVAPLAPGHYVLLAEDKLVEVRGPQVRELACKGFSELQGNRLDDSVLCYGAHAVALYRDGELRPLPAPGGALRDIVTVDRGEWVVATDQGLVALTSTAAKADTRPLPWPELTCIDRDSAGRLWCGSTRGAFSIDRDGRIDYYAGRRWLHDDRVIDIHVTRDDNVYVLTAGGLSRLEFPRMTLAEKADVHLRHLRGSHTRYGLVSDITLVDGDLAHARLTDTDNDGLWSGMYLASEAYRHAVTRADDARANVLDGFDAMERLVTISGIPGFQARTFELDGFKVSDPERWRTLPQRDFEWKGHTSSDEIVGSMFFFSVFHETVAKNDPPLARRTASTVAAVVDHILDHDLYLVDIDGKPTLWGKWNPEYVNTPMVGGDRRLNSIEILSFLQLAYALTHNERYKDAFYELVKRHGYAENTVRYLPDPFGDWNHSDDELYWLSYYNLLKHCFDPELKATFLESARAHYEVNRRKRNPLWSFIYGAIGGAAFDLDGALWILREYPLDNRDWRMRNSHRKDIRLDARYETGPETVEVLSPAERHIHKWNTSEMVPDGGGDGNRCESGAEYLLPYWMARYYGFIEAPRGP